MPESKKTIRLRDAFKIKLSARLVKNINPSGSYSPDSLISIDGFLYFAADLRNEGGGGEENPINDQPINQGEADNGTDEDGSNGETDSKESGTSEGDGTDESGSDADNSNSEDDETEADHEDDEED